MAVAFPDNPAKALDPETRPKRSNSNQIALMRALHDHEVRGTLSIMSANQTTGAKYGDDAEEGLTSAANSSDVKFTPSPV